MEENKKIFIIYVETSYLTNMPAIEKADWNRLLEHLKACVSDLNIQPRLEIHISEISIREYRSRKIDNIRAKIEQARARIDELQDEWQKNDIAKELEYPFPKDIDIFPKQDEIHAAADNLIKKFLDNGIKQIKIKEHHKDGVWDNYFNWKPPFTATISERADKSVREKRRVHIPDAWILEPAIDAKNAGQKLLCLCKDENLSTALESHEHMVFKSAKDILNVLFPPINLELSDDVKVFDVTETEVHGQSPLDDLLSKTPNDGIKSIFLHLLGFVVPLNAPTHDSLIDAVASKGFDRKLTEACAIILSDKLKPYIKDTGTHYIAGNKEVCTAASDRLTQEIIDLLD